MKFKTVYEGSKAIVINRNGQISKIDGPKRLFLFLSKLELLTKHVADLNQYLIVKHISGKVEHIPGPCAIWFNRFEHESIRVEQAYKLDDSQVIIVYNRDNEKKTVSRRLVKGPCMFIPSPNEWLHQFKWHAQDEKNIGSLIPEMNKFQILTVKPDFFHYYVKEVRTLDDSLITIKLMVIYELKDINLMLDKTQDPISDFINAICADVVSYVSKLTFSQFLNDGASKLNNLESYEQLNQRAFRNGYKIESIIYNGYKSSDALQKIQENAIESRTKLRLNAEIDKQNNELLDLKLNSENKRFGIENEITKLKCKFEQKLLDAKTKFQLENDQLKHDTELKLKDIEQNALNEIKFRELKIDEQYLENLSNLNVNVNNYQLELCRSKSKIDRLYELINE